MKRAKFLWDKGLILQVLTLRCHGTSCSVEEEFCVQWLIVSPTSKIDFGCHGLFESMIE